MQRQAVRGNFPRLGVGAPPSNNIVHCTSRVYKYINIKIIKCLADYAQAEFPVGEPRLRPGFGLVCLSACLLCLLMMLPPSGGRAATSADDNNNNIVNDNAYEFSL